MPSQSESTSHPTSRCDNQRNEENIGYLHPHNCHICRPSDTDESSSHRGYGSHCNDLKRVLSFFNRDGNQNHTWIVSAGEHIRVTARVILHKDSSLELIMTTFICTYLPDTRYDVFYKQH